MKKKKSSIKLKRLSRGELGQVVDVASRTFGGASKYISHSVVSDSATSWTVAHQVPLSWDSPGKNTGVGCHALLQGNLPAPGIKPGSLALQADSLPSEPPGKPSKYLYLKQICRSMRIHIYKSWIINSPLSMSRKKMNCICVNPGHGRACSKFKSEDNKWLRRKVCEK